jgi:uncharacterized Tic20 family protein
LAITGRFVVPFAGLVAPIIILQVRKDTMPELDVHGKIVLSWIMSQILDAIICGILVLVVIGIPLLIVLGALGITFPVIGGIKANEGKVWPYPLSLRLLTQVPLYGLKRKETANPAFRGGHLC